MKLNHVLNTISMITATILRDLGTIKSAIFEKSILRVYSTVERFIASQEEWAKLPKFRRDKSRLYKAIFKK